MHTAHWRFNIHPCGQNSIIWMRTEIWNIITFNTLPASNWYRMMHSMCRSDRQTDGTEAGALKLWLVIHCCCVQVAAALRPPFQWTSCDSRAWAHADLVSIGKQGEHALSRGATSSTTVHRHLHQWNYSSIRGSPAVLGGFCPVTLDNFPSPPKNTVSKTVFFFSRGIWSN